MSNDLESRVALVTGGSRGIGRATCIALARQGARVAINYLQNESAAIKTLSQIEAVGGVGAIFQANVADELAVADMVAAIDAELGLIDLLVTNAAVSMQAGHSTLDLDDFRRIMATNVEGTLIPIMAVKDGMVSRGFGGIVCVASVAGL